MSSKTGFLLKLQNSFNFYWVGFTEAWHNRAKLGQYPNQHMEFLPAALEIIETPASPLGRQVGYCLMGLFTIALLWAIIGKVDIVASAEGKIIPGGRVKHIQPSTPGVIKNIFLREGQTVKAGDPLIELDQTLATADRTRVETELKYLDQLIARERALQSMLENESGTLSNYSETAVTSAQELPLEWETSPSATEQWHQRQQLWQQWQDYQSQRAALASKIINHQAELASSRAVVDKLTSTIPLIRKRTQALKDLYQKGLGSEVQFLQLEEERITQEQNLIAEQGRQKQLLAAIEEARQRKLAQEAAVRNKNLQVLEEAVRQKQAQNQELAKAQDLFSKQVLYAPVAGQIQQLDVHTIGGVVTAAQSLMLVVPEEDFLEVEATLENKDIGFINVGQAAEIKIHTFPFTRYGFIHAEILGITADAIENEKQGLIYKIRLRMKSNKLFVDTKWVDLLPGMAVTAEVKTGERRLIEFFMSPLMRYKQESIRER